MIPRRHFLSGLAAAVLATSADAAVPVQSAVIGVGPFEFPIPGTYTYERQSGGLVISTADGLRAYSVAQFSGPETDPPAQSIARLEELTRRNWQRFLENEKGTLVKPFQRTDLSPTLAIFAMASEFREGKNTHYYVQFAATTGTRTALVFAEGDGPAGQVFEELEPLIRKVRVAQS